MEAVREPFYNPFCKHVFAAEPRFDFTNCFETTTINSIPILILLVVGGASLSTLVKKFSSGNKPESGKGAHAYISKIVSTTHVHQIQI